MCTAGARGRFPSKRTRNYNTSVGASYFGIFLVNPQSILSKACNFCVGQKKELQGSCYIFRMVLGDTDANILKYFEWALRKLD